MRARYAAYALEESNYVFRTWHPRTRPDEVAADPAVRWTGLEVLATSGGEQDDQDGVVEFRASYDAPGGRGALHETSRFTRRAGRWVYVEGDVRS
ncbi:SEC-C motif-containing protein [Nocardioides massiliensis]|uniref:SEC-C motif-containing protein n=2 Tax=Nocardioides massiliensis TaxID=1325935 RepID=A0ABT9NRS0_9ACTN|nr:SEC-C motif-containing protein [Nocardioides massiliensis]